MNFTLDAARPQAVSDRVAGLALVAAFVACYAAVLMSLVQHWATSDMYNHGFLIPVISGYVLYERRALLASTPLAPSPTVGWGVVAMGLFALVLGQLGGVQAVSQLSMLVTITGAVLVLFGWQVMRHLWFPLIYLLFMIPIWEVFTTPLHGPFQQLSSYLGTSILHLVGIPVRREGVLVHLPNVTLEVAEVCSGVNFLVAIVAVGVPQAYLSLRSPVRRALAVILGAVFALASNGLRVALIGWLAYYGLSGEDIHGPAHSLQGMFVAVFGFIALFVVVHLLARSERAAEGDAAPPSRVTANSVAAKSSSRSASHMSRVSVGVLFVVLLAVAAFVMTRTSTIVEPARALASFPEDLANWRGGAVMAPPAYFTNNGADQEVSRIYYGPLNRSVHMYVGYFTRQQQGKELVDYRTTDLRRNAASVRIPLGSAEIVANEAVVRAGKRTQYVIYWYDVNGRVTASPYMAKAWTIWDSVIADRSNGAVVMLATDIASPDERNRVAGDVKELARLSAQQLTSYLPR